jgi:hypothetical protein
MGWEKVQALVSQMDVSWSNGYRLTAIPLKSVLSSKNMFVPRKPAMPSCAPGFVGAVLHFKSQHPPPLTVLIQYASSAPRLTKLGASAPFAFHVVFQAS